MPDDILHFGAVRLRVVGSGNLALQFKSLDDESTLSLVPITMASSASREPTRLTNFISQRARLKVSTDTIDEVFKINRISIYIKQLYTQYPS